MPFLLIQPLSFKSEHISKVTNVVPQNRIEYFTFDRCASNSVQQTRFCVCLDSDDVGRLKFGVCSVNRRVCDYSGKPHVTMCKTSCARAEKHTFAFNQACMTALMINFQSNEAFRL